MYLSLAAGVRSGAGWTPTALRAEEGKRAHWVALSHWVWLWMEMEVGE